MNFKKEKLLTIITEVGLELLIIKDIKKAGATGYTVTEVHGKGEHGLRKDLWEHSSNIKLEVICSVSVCSKIVDYLKSNYLKNYAMMLFVQDIDVI